MRDFLNLSDTICAQATPPGTGGISIIRVCGPSALAISKKIMPLKEGPESHRAYFLTITDLDKNPVDEAVVTYFAKGQSYTGDETLEISCHGSPAVVEETTNNLLLAGCRLAERGEFTYRAFMNDRIDLLQAESVLSLIESETKKAAEISLRQLRGELSKKIFFLKEKLLHVMAHIEANIDFSLENLESISPEKALIEITEIKKEFSALAESYQKGRILSDNFTVVLAGEPNAGKSSLFNLFVQAEKAIVTDIAGTTRDALEGFSVISGIKIKYVDTAGLRDTKDAIERLGIKKTREQIKEADQIFYVIDATNEEASIDKEILEKHAEKTTLLINKTDLGRTKSEIIFKGPVFNVSAKKEETLLGPLNFLEQQLKKQFNESSAVVLKARQFEIIIKIKESLEKAEALCQEQASQEFIAFELRSAVEQTMELLGEKFDDKILQKIFQEFCIGK